MKGKIILILTLFILLLVGCKTQEKKEIQKVEKTNIEVDEEDNTYTSDEVETQEIEETKVETTTNNVIKNTNIEVVEKENIYTSTEEEIQKNYADVFLISDDKRYTSEEYFDLNDTPKTFEINFNNSVNKKDVENYLKDCINGIGKIEFDWLNSKKLLVYISQLAVGNYSFYFEFSNINPQILGGFCFSIGTQDEIFSYDIVNKITEQLSPKVQEDIRWYNIELLDRNVIMLNTSYVKDGYIFRNNNYYNPITKKNYALLNNVQEELYKESFNTENIFHRDETIQEHSFGKIYKQKNDELELIYSNEDLVDFKKYENKSISMINKNSFIKLIIYDNELNSTTEYQLNILYLLREQGVELSDYILLEDDNKLLIEALDSSKEPFLSLETHKNLYVLDLQTKELNILLENFHDPIKINDDLILVKDNQENNSILNIQTLTLDSFPQDIKTAQQVFVLSDSEIVCNNNGTICIYDIVNNKINYLGQNIKSILNVYDNNIFYIK